MEKVTDKSAAREQMRENFRNYDHKFSDEDIEKLCDDAESDIAAWAEWGEKQRRAGLEEAARAMCEHCHNGAYAPAVHFRGVDWTHLKYKTGAKVWCKAAPVWAIRVIGQPETPSAYEMSRISPQLCEVHGVVHKCALMAATTAAKIGETKTIIESLREALERPVKGRARPISPTAEQGRYRIGQVVSWQGQEGICNGKITNITRPENSGYVLEIDGNLHLLMIDAQPGEVAQHLNGLMKSGILREVPWPEETQYVQTGEGGEGPSC